MPENEVLLQGLLGHIQTPQLEAIDLGPPKGRGVITREKIQRGDFVCEYKTHKVYPVGSPLQKELKDEYDGNGEGSFVVETSFVVADGKKLCFNATRRYSDLGRLINHAPRGYNLKIGRPMHCRGKWRIGLIALRDIEVDEELTYDYGVRGQEWMRTKGTSIQRQTNKKQYKRNYFWCPVVDCRVGPVQKIHQHLQKFHKMDLTTVAKVAKKKRRAPLEAVIKKTPNPATRSSGIRPLEMFVTPATAAISVSQPQEPAAGTSTSGHTFPPGTISGTHEGGPFLEGFMSYLTTRAGGLRGKDSATQIVKYVGKYLYHIDPDNVREEELLKTDSVVAYLEAVQKTGIGNSGVLHRILSHKVAVHFMRLAVSWP